MSWSISIILHLLICKYVCGYSFSVSVIHDIATRKSSSCQWKPLKASVNIEKEEGNQQLDSRGVKSIIGGAMTHLALGSVYTWGNFLSYAPTSLRFFDGQEHPGYQPDALYVIPANFVFQSLMMPFGPTLAKKFGTRRTLLTGCWLMAASTFIASYQKSLLSFMLYYSAFFGLGIGISYIVPMVSAWSYLPNNKGFASGGILAGYGAGGFIFSLIGSKIANPSKLNPVNGVFPDAVYKNFPIMLRTLAVIYFALTLLGTLVVSEAKQETSNMHVASASPGATVSQALKSSQFWMMWLMAVASGSAGLNTVSIYKQFASTSAALNSDQFLAIVGGIGSIFNGSGRILWGNLFDKVGLKKSFFLLSAFQMLSMLTYAASTKSQSLFLINTCALFMCLAGNLALMPPAVQKMFGPRAGATIYGILYSAFAVASIAGGILTKSLAKSLGWKGLFATLSSFSIVASLILSQLKPFKEQYPESSV